MIKFNLKHGSQEAKPGSRARKPSQEAKPGSRARKPSQEAKPSVYGNNKSSQEILLYHYSHNDFEDKIKIDFFGDNYFTNESNNMSNIKRSYFYIDNITEEYFFRGSKFLYIARINKNKLYNINEDKLNLNTKSYPYLIKNIKKLGYSGIIGNNGFNIVILFKNIKIQEKIVL